MLLVLKFKLGEGLAQQKTANSNGSVLSLMPFQSDSLTPTQGQRFNVKV